jgi:NADH-quinone oxidoreductase subunit H
MNLVTLGEVQSGLFTNWGIFHDPFMFGVFWVYFTCAIASVNRAPFDLAEAESELVAGFHTEYSGLRWSFFFMAEYGSMFLVSALAAILFFGGWNGPVPIFSQILPAMTGMPWAYEQGETAWRLTGYIAQVAGCANLILKAIFGVTFMMWVRWTLPRLRIDQVLTTCLKYCVPLSAACFVGAILWKLGVLWPFPWIDDIAPRYRDQAQRVHEAWVLIEDAAAKPAGENQSKPAESDGESKPAEKVAQAEVQP